MTVKEFKNTTIAKSAIKITYYNAINGRDISNKSPLLLDKYTVIGTACNADGSIDVDVILRIR